MAQKSERAKKRIINDFETMKSFEESAHNTYAKIASDPRLLEQYHMDILNHIARDEQKHTKILQQMIELIKNEL